MDFDSIFSNSDILGMMLKSYTYKTIDDSLRGIEDNELRVAILKVFKESIEELIEKYSPKGE